MPRARSGPGSVNVKIPGSGCCGNIINLRLVWVAQLLLHVKAAIGDAHLDPLACGRNRGEAVQMCVAHAGAASSWVTQASQQHASLHAVAVVDMGMVAAGVGESCSSLTLRRRDEPARAKRRACRLDGANYVGVQSAWSCQQQIRGSVITAKLALFLCTRLRPPRAAGAGDM